MERETASNGEGQDPADFLEPSEIARREAENGLRQFDAAIRIIEDATKAGAPFTLQPSLICDMNNLAIINVHNHAGEFRLGPITIKGTTHRPPPADEVPGLVGEMCDYANGDGAGRSALHQAAYLLWRINWIHPFVNGNGRTSRMISYMILCIRLGFVLPGKNTIPEQIAADREPYYHGLDAADAADAAWKDGRIDVSVLERYLSELLERQLHTVIEAAEAE